MGAYSCVYSSFYFNYIPLEVYPTLTDEEAARNSTGPDRLFVGSKHPAFEFLKELYADGAGEGTVSW